MRIGIGYDVHAFVLGRPLILGGVTIPHTHGLDGHSDADAVIHAAVDALLGAAALGDIGQHFPSSDSRWRDAPSSTFLAYTRDLLTEHGWRMANVDVTIVAQAPKMGPFILPMRFQLAEALQLPVEQISVKATTTDHLGFTGRGEGLAALAVACIEPASRV
jgi:2-C-methyl-D-erythritol 2,4-cyclodiphosphate synthase